MNTIQDFLERIEAGYVAFALLALWLTGFWVGVAWLVRADGDRSKDRDYEWERHPLNPKNKR